MANENFRLVSPDFDNGGRLPRKYTADGQGALKELSPPLEWYGVPYGTKSLALLVQDIDAPKPSSPLVPWVHWVVINIPPSLKGLPAGFSRMEQVLGGDYAVIQEGVNDWKMHGYRGPKPPTHGHRYQFMLYALNDWLDLGKKVHTLFFSKYIGSGAAHLVIELLN